MDSSAPAARSGWRVNEVVVRAGYKSKLQRIWLGARQPVTCARIACRRKVECIDYRLLIA